MKLGHLLFDREITGKQLSEVAKSDGITLPASAISAVMRRRRRASGGERLKIIHALRLLKVPASIIADIDELQAPKPDDQQ